MNEELQSANEELETSKEELQSLNEELTTVNNQLQDKLEELQSANNDMANLLNCTDIAIIFLDNKFRIKRYTPPAMRLFNLIPQILIGRSATSLPSLPIARFNRTSNRSSEPFLRKRSNCGHWTAVGGNDRSPFTERWTIASKAWSSHLPM